MDFLNSYMHVPIKRFVLRFEAADLVFDLDDLAIFDLVPPPKLDQPQVVIPAKNLLLSIWQLVNSFVEPSTRPDEFVSTLSTSFPLTFDCESLNPKNQPQSEPLPQFFLEAQQLLQSNPLVLCSEGIGGTYFVQDGQGSPFAVFKPVDEEPGAPNNPKKLVSSPLLPPGGGAIREVAAFLLDRGFSAVPPTYLVQDVQTKNRGIKTGSVQQFIPNDGESSSHGSSSFIAEDVHHIGLLDIRLFNLDRNGENILLKAEGKQHHLIPIDHTYILPETLEGAFFEWMYWPQAKLPFSQTSLDFVKSIDLEADATVLRNLGFSELSVQTMLVSTILLKHCVSLGKTLFDIAKLVCRDVPKNPSLLEDLVLQAASLSGRHDTRMFCDSFSAIIQERVH